MSSAPRITPSPGETRAPGGIVVPMRVLDQLDDRGLLRAILDGNPRAPTVFFDRFADDVAGRLRRLLGPQADVAAAVNEVFLRALDRLEDVTDPEGLKKWLHTIAIYVAREHRRTMWRTRFLEFRPWNFFLENAGPSEEAPLEARDALRRVYAILERLSEDDRTLFVLRFIEELELTEVAELQGISLASAKRHLARARKKFDAMAERDALLLDWLESTKSSAEVSS
jgi:RNA polymerase sigma-70 factor, ECF subfamily